MSNKDYTKYAKGTSLIVDDIIDIVEPEATPEATPEAVVEPTPVAEPDPIVEPVEVRKIGRVSGCAKLNVRVAGKFNSDVVCEIPSNTEVEIDEEESTVDFYKICTSSGIEGFCMKTYITVE